MSKYFTLDDENCDFPAGPVQTEMSKTLPATTYPVFVYGTLKKGYGNHRLLKDAAFAGRAVTNDRYAMLDAGFPVLMKAGGERRNVVGELYKVDQATLERLDRLESKGRMYDRVAIQVKKIPAADNEIPYTYTAWAYIGIPTYWEKGWNVEQTKPHCASVLPIKVWDWKYDDDIKVPVFEKPEGQQKVTFRDGSGTNRSTTLEPSFVKALDEIAERMNTSRRQLLIMIRNSCDKTVGKSGLASAIRQFVLRETQGK